MKRGSVRSEPFKLATNKFSIIGNSNWKPHGRVIHDWGEGGSISQKGEVGRWVGGRVAGSREAGGCGVGTPLV